MLLLRLDDEIFVFQSIPREIISSALFLLLKLLIVLRVSSDWIVAWFNKSHNEKSHKRFSVCTWVCSEPLYNKHKLIESNGIADQANNVNYGPVPCLTNWNSMNLMDRDFSMCLFRSSSFRCVPNLCVLFLFFFFGGVFVQSIQQLFIFCSMKVWLV